MGVLYSIVAGDCTGTFYIKGVWGSKIPKNYRVNDRIRVPNVLVIDEKGITSPRNGAVL